MANNSPIVWQGEIGLASSAAAANESSPLCFPIPDGLEIPAGQQITFTHLESSATGTISMTVIGYEY